MIFQPLRIPDVVWETHPAHVHMNLLPRLQRRGFGSGLLGAWLEAAAARGVERVHVGVGRANPGGVAFWRSRGFVEIEAAKALAGRTLWLGRGCRS